MLKQHRQTLGQAIHSALQRERSLHNKVVPILSKKESFRVEARGRRWGDWVDVFSQLGVYGTLPELNVNKVKITFKSLSEMNSSFSIQIKGGDRLIETVGDTSTNTVLVTITGNVATTLFVRCKSHSLPQDIFVNVF